MKISVSVSSAGSRHYRSGVWHPNDWRDALHALQAMQRQGVGADFRISSSLPGCAIETTQEGAWVRIVGSDRLDFLPRPFGDAVAQHFAFLQRYYAAPETLAVTLPDGSVTLLADMPFLPPDALAWLARRQPFAAVQCTETSVRLQRTTSDYVVSIGRWVVYSEHACVAPPLGEFVRQASLQRARIRCLPPLGEWQ